MKVLVACECSGTVRDAFIGRGHDAVSCDLQPTDADGPHYVGDVCDIINDGWDLMIAHPPCTYMSCAGACRMYPTKGQVDYGRLLKGQEAKAFFMLCLNSDIPKICVENPLPLKIIGLPKPTQQIQPYEYGDPYSKRTLLWLKNLPRLQPTNVLKRWQPFIASGTSRNKGKTKGMSFAAGSKARSITFQGIADAMADQCGDPKQQTL